MSKNSQEKVFEYFTDCVRQFEKYSIYRDPFPVSSGHVVFVCNENNNADLSLCFDHAIRMGTMLVENGQADGFNIGTNIGKSAGNDFTWPHVHLIPRRYGDCNNFFGGVRKVIDGQSDYTSTQYRHPDGVDITEKLSKYEYEYNISQFPPLFGPGDVPGYLSEYDVESIKFLSNKISANGKIVEVGTFLGKSAVEWARNLTDKNCEIICVDSFNSPISVLSELLELGDFVVPQGPVNQLDLFRFYTKEYTCIKPLQAFFNDKFEFPINVNCVFEDSDHTQKTLTYALPFWWNKIVNGGILCGHDYGEYSDVKKCVDLFALTNNLEVNTFSNGSSIWYIEKK